MTDEASVFVVLLVVNLSQDLEERPVWLGSVFCSQNFQVSSPNLLSTQWLCEFFKAFVLRPGKAPTCFRNHFLVLLSFLETLRVTYLEFKPLGLALKEAEIAT